MTEPTAHPDPVEVPGPLVRHERTDAGVDVLTLSHGKVNALSSAVLAELRDRVGELRAAGARAVVVTGGPKLFAAGADITEFAERGGDEPFAVAAPERVAEIGAGFLDALEDLAALPCPTIAAVNGVALGGGCELALACEVDKSGIRRYRIAGGADAGSNGVGNLTASE